MPRLWTGLWVVAAVALVASPALGHAANLTFTFQEGDPCPSGRVSCIVVTGGPGTESNIRDDTAHVRFAGIHPVAITVANAGRMDHNLTFEPGTALANYSVEDPIPPGETVSFNFTTVEDVPASTYGFFGGQPGHRDLGERGRFVVEEGPQPEPDQSEVVDEVVGIPGPGLVVVATALSGAALASSRRS